MPKHNGALRTTQGRVAGFKTTLKCVVRPHTSDTFTQRNHRRITGRLSLMTGWLCTSMECVWGVCLALCQQLICCNHVVSEMETKRAEWIVVTVRSHRQYLLLFL